MAHIDNIRKQLLWDKIREIQSRMPEDMFQEMKAMPISKWAQTWIEAGLNASMEDLTMVHGILWPEA